MFISLCRYPLFIQIVSAAAALVVVVVVVVVGVGVRVRGYQGSGKGSIILAFEIVVSGFGFIDCLYQYVWRSQ
ncbi:hypothetical protein FB192DRAFT_1043481 [Mucor lusitanicus]|uniref:Uncharacterized protein n=1 Tax=Mucor circinelloides f. lusitanicus TaxID=29924 RepID=A0A8H4EW24_MUCCL|nr:hypothetical protein FB192DRAFT_1043481 [Mucor lusitanicus]